MQCIHVPASVAVAHLDEPVEGRLDSRIVPAPEGREHVEADQKVVVIVDGVVEAEPGRVRRGTFAEQSSLKIEFGAPLDRSNDLGGTRGGRERCERGEGLPAIERPSAGAKAMPTAILLLMPHEPIDRGLEVRVLREEPIAEPTTQVQRPPEPLDIYMTRQRWTNAAQLRSPMR